MSRRRNNDGIDYYNSSISIISVWYLLAEKCREMSELIITKYTIKGETSMQILRNWKQMKNELVKAKREPEHEHIFYVDIWHNAYLLREAVKRSNLQKVKIIIKRVILEERKMKLCFRCETEQPDITPIAPDGTLASELLGAKGTLPLCGDCHEELDNIKTIPTDEVNLPKKE